MKTGFEAFRLGFAAYLAPYIFAMNPVLVRPDTGLRALTEELGILLVYDEEIAFTLHAFRNALKKVSCLSMIERPCKVIAVDS